METRWAADAHDAGLVGGREIYWAADVYDAGLVGGCGKPACRAADAHDAGLVGGCGKSAGPLMLVMPCWSGAVGNPLGS